MTLLTRLSQVIGGGNSGAPSLDRLLEQMDRELENFQELVQPAATSRPRTAFDSELPPEEMSMANMSPRQIARLLPSMVPLMLAMRRSAGYYDGGFQPSAEEATSEFLAALEAMAEAEGATAVRFVRVPPNAIFRGKGLPHEYAIVFTVEMDRETMATAPSFEAMKEVVDGYKRLAFISNKLARFLRKNGFAAYPGTALGGITDYPHLAELAGLGAIGYHGLLISPHEGARLRINTIYTNISNLPLTTENEHLWVRDFCAMCRKCVRDCPVDAIYPEPRPRGDGGMQCIDHDPCRDYFTANYGCAICLAVCPFSQVGYDKVRQRFRGNASAPQFRIPVRAKPGPAEVARRGVT